jgi:5-methyltetrahydropteroyltriglutamate--homocysteine methyltransferase
MTAPHRAEHVGSLLRPPELRAARAAHRAGGFAPPRFVPRDQTVVLGLVITKTGERERKDDLLRCIEQAAGYVPIERLALSPRCAVTSGRAGNRLTWDDQRRQLERVVATARAV